MATWDDLLTSKKMQLAQQLCKGKPTAENMNRALESLANNPRVLARTAKEIGIDDEITVTEDGNIEKIVGGSVGSRVPQPKSGESAKEYRQRLIDRGDDSEITFDEVFGVVKGSAGGL